MYQHVHINTHFRIQLIFICKKKEIHSLSISDQDKLVSFFKGWRIPNSKQFWNKLWNECDKRNNVISNGEWNCVGAKRRMWRISSFVSFKERWGKKMRRKPEEITVEKLIEEVTSSSTMLSFGCFLGRWIIPTIREIVPVETRSKEQ